MERLALKAQAGVLQFALLAAGAAHEHGAHPLGVVLGHRGCSLGRLVVGMRVHTEQSERFGHPSKVIGAVPGGRWPISPTLPP